MSSLGEQEPHMCFLVMSDSSQGLVGEGAEAPQIFSFAPARMMVMGRVSL